MSVTFALSVAVSVTAASASLGGWIWQQRGVTGGAEHLPKDVYARGRGGAMGAWHDPPVTYAPEADGRPDPGEVCWAWVPYEDDPRRGKDRPVLVLARDGDDLLCLQLTSKDHDRDAADEERHGRYWMDVGTGGWDREGRPSEVRLDRVLRLAESEVRREGAALNRAVFEAVVEAASRR